MDIRIWPIHKMCAALMNDVMGCLRDIRIDPYDVGVGLRGGGIHFE